MDTFVRVTRSPVVSIAKIRGRVRGAGSEFVLACYMRFASREKAILAQVEVGAGVHPGGGGTERLPLLDGFVDVLARRIASFDRRPIAAAKNLINQVSLPPVDRLLDGLTSFATALTWPESQRRFQALSDRGLGQPGEMENRFGELLGTLLET